MYNDKYGGEYILINARTSVWKGFQLLTLPGKNALFLNWRRKKAMKNVPAMRTRESSAVLGWPRTLSGPGTAVLLLRTWVVFSIEVPPAVLLSREQYFSGCSLKIWGCESEHNIVTTQYTHTAWITTFWKNKITKRLSSRCHKTTVKQTIQNHKPG